MTNNEEVILAFDQSSKVSGYSIFKNNKLINFDKFSFDDSNLDIRLMKIRGKVEELIDKHQPDKIILEDIQLQSNVANNVQTYKALAQVQGVIIELLTELHVPYELVLASSWKATLGIKGRNRQEQKKQAQQYVFNKYGQNVIQDIADAICIGEHYIQNSKNDWSE